MKLNTFTTLLEGYDFPEGVKLLNTELELLNASDSVQGNPYLDYFDDMRKGENIAISFTHNNEYLIQIYSINDNYFLIPGRHYMDTRKLYYTPDGQPVSSDMWNFEYDVMHDIHAFIAKKYGDKEDFDWVLFSECYALDK